MVTALAGDAGEVPATLVALTVNVYAVMAEPPLLVGAVQDTAALASAALADTALGAPGTVLGVTPALASEAVEGPTMLVALTVNLYAVPLVRPVTVALVAPVVVAVRPPGEAVTVYLVTAEPPLLLGAVQDTAAAALPGVAATRVGAPGTVFG